MKKYGSFTWDEINNFSLAQIRLFYRELELLRRDEMKNLVHACLAGARYEPDALKELFSKLERE